MIVSSRSTSRTLIQMRKAHAENTSLIYSIPSILSISLRSCSMRLKRDTVLKELLLKKKLSKPLMSGSKSFKKCHSFLVSYYFKTSLLNIYHNIEKKGKTLHLLKAKSKRINPNKRRKVIPLLGSIKDFHNAMQNQNQNQMTS